MSKALLKLVLIELLLLPYTITRAAVVTIASIGLLALQISTILVIGFILVNTPFFLLKLYTM